MGGIRGFNTGAFQGAFTEGDGQDLDAMAIRAKLVDSTRDGDKEGISPREVEGQIGVFDGGPRVNLGESALRLIFEAFPGTELVEA